MGSSPSPPPPTLPTKTKQQRIDADERRRKSVGVSSFRSNILSDLAENYGYKSSTGA